VFLLMRRDRLSHSKKDGDTVKMGKTEAYPVPGAAIGRYVLYGGTTSGGKKGQVKEEKKVEILLCRPLMEPKAMRG